eukprot:5222170-Pyramimonas_sp.AAC.1
MPGAGAATPPKGKTKPKQQKTEEQPKKNRTGATEPCRLLRGYPGTHPSRLQYLARCVQLDAGLPLIPWRCDL